MIQQSSSASNGDSRSATILLADALGFRHSRRARTPSRLEESSSCLRAPFCSFLLSFLLISILLASNARSTPEPASSVPSIDPAIFDGIGINVHFTRWISINSSQHDTAQQPLFEPIEWDAEFVQIPAGTMRVRLKCQAVLTPYDGVEQQQNGKSLQYRLKVSWQNLTTRRDEQLNEEEFKDYTREAEQDTNVADGSMANDEGWRCFAQVPLPGKSGQSGVAISRPLRIVNTPLGHPSVDDGTLSESAPKDNRVTATETDDSDDGNDVAAAGKRRREEEEAETFAGLMHKIQGASVRMVCYTDRARGERPERAQWKRNGQPLLLNNPRVRLSLLQSATSTAQPSASFLEGLQLSIAFLESSDQGFYDCVIRSDQNGKAMERIQRILLLVHHSTSARLERVQVELEHQPERCLRVQFVQPTGTRLDDAYRRQYFLAFHRLSETEDDEQLETMNTGEVISKKMINREAKQNGEVNDNEDEVIRLIGGGVENDDDQQMKNGTADGEADEQKFKQSPSISGVDPQQKQQLLNSHPFRLSKQQRACRVVPEAGGEGRVRCEFRCCQRDACGAQLEQGGTPYAFHAAVVLRDEVITALSQPPALASTWDAFAPESLPLDFLYDRSTKQLLVRWRLPNPFRLRGRLQAFQLEAEFYRKTKLENRESKRLGPREREFRLLFEDTDDPSFAIRIRVVPETRSGLSPEMDQKREQYPHYVFTNWMEQHLPAAISSIPAPLVKIHQLRMGNAEVSLSWEEARESDVELVVQAISADAPWEAGGSWRSNTTGDKAENGGHGMVLEEGNKMEVGRIYQFCSCFVTAENVHGPWRCQLVPILDENGHLLKAKESAEAETDHTDDEEGGDDEDQHLPEPVLCERARCRCEFHHSATSTVPLAMAISWESSASASESQLQLGTFTHNEPREVMVHYTLDETEVSMEAWKSPPLPVTISSRGGLRQIQFDIEDELQLLPNTTYRFMLEALRSKKTRHKQTSSNSVEGTYFDCRTPNELDFPPPTNFRLERIASGAVRFSWRAPRLPLNRTEFADGKHVVGFELHFRRVDNSNILLEAQKAADEELLISNFHRTIQGSQADSYLLTERPEPPGTYRAWLCTRWTRSVVGASPSSACSARLSLPLFFSSSLITPSLPHLPADQLPSFSDQTSLLHPPTIANPPRLPLHRHPAYRFAIVLLLILILLLLVATGALRAHTLWMDGKLFRRKKKMMKKVDEDVEDGIELPPLDSRCNMAPSTSIPKCHSSSNGTPAGVLLEGPRSWESAALLDNSEVDQLEPQKMVRSMSEQFEEGFNMKREVGAVPDRRTIGELMQVEVETHADQPHWQNSELQIDQQLAKPQHSAETKYSSQPNFGGQTSTSAPICSSNGLNDQMVSRAYKNPIKRLQRRHTFTGTDFSAYVQWRRRRRNIVRSSSCSCAPPPVTTAMKHLHQAPNSGRHHEWADLRCTMDPNCTNAPKQRRCSLPDLLIPTANLFIISNSSPGFITMRTNITNVDEAAIAIPKHRYNHSELFEQDTHPAGSSTNSSPISGKVMISLGSLGPRKSNCAGNCSNRRYSSSAACSSAESSAQFVRSADQPTDEPADKRPLMTERDEAVQRLSNDRNYNGLLLFDDALSSPVLPHRSMSHSATKSPFGHCWPHHHPPFSSPSYSPYP